MAAFTIRDVTFFYPRQEKPALDKLNLEIEEGEFAVICGQSGSGKSTLLRNLKSILAPSGRKQGEILFFGTPIEQVPQKIQAARIGYVLQDPDSQLVTDKVWHELAFGLESLGYDTKTIRLRVAEMTNFFGIQTWFRKSVDQLSGGQKQILNLAAVMTMQPDVLILDEPTSQLDPIAAGDFLETIKKINRELGTTILLSEHRLEEVLPDADQVIVMDRGQILCKDTPVRVGQLLAEKKHEMFLAMPAPLQIAANLQQEGIGSGMEFPVDVRGGRAWLNGLFQGCPPEITELPEDKKTDGEQKTVIRMRDVWFRYERQGEDVIRDLSMEVRQGDFFCLMGGNGTGKTTTLNLLSGISRPWRGKILVNGKTLEDYKNQELFQGVLGVLPQNPQTLFVEKNVRLDLLEMLEGRGLGKAEQEERVRKTAARFGLEEFLETHPYDLSGGEQQRVALAKLLLQDPEILLLDEPTKGLDSHFKSELAEILRSLCEEGRTIVMVSHDVEFCGRYGDRCAMFFDGRITAVDTPRKFFSGNSFYTTAANRMSRHMFRQAVTAEDVICLCKKNRSGAEGGDVCCVEQAPAAVMRKERSFSKDLRKEDEVEALPLENRPALKKKRLHGNLCMAAALILAPLTILAGFFLLEDRKYYFISLLMVFYTMLPFFGGFERSRPQARELVILAVMIGLSVAGRAAFFAVPQIKPMAALAVISGIALGRQSGFLVGSMSMFVSNFMFGQGPWTPWQMLGMGLVGFLAGLLAEKGFLGKQKLPVLIFGGLATTFIYGLIVDGWSVLSATAEPSWQLAVTIYGLGFPLNLLHGAGTVIFLFFLERPMREKLERIKVKYGMKMFSQAEASR